MAVVGVFCVCLEAAIAGGDACGATKVDSLVQEYLRSKESKEGEE